MKSIKCIVGLHHWIYTCLHYRPNVITKKRCERCDKVIDYLNDA